MKSFLIILGIIILLIIIISIIYIYFINKVNEYIIRISEAENRINKNIANKFEILDNAISKVKELIKLDDNLFQDIIKFRARRINDFKLNKNLDKSYETFFSLFKENKELQNNEEIIKDNKQIIIINEELNALTEYYNVNVDTYNSLIKTFPINIIKKIKNWSEKNPID